MAKLLKKGLNGDSKQRRATYRDLCRKHGVDKVKRVDNPDAKCKNTRVEIS